MKLFRKKVLPCFVVIAILATSLGSGFSTAFAASQENTSAIKNGLIGVVALGLLAVAFSGHHNTPAAATVKPPTTTPPSTTTTTPPSTTTTTPPSTTTTTPVSLTPDEQTAFALLNADRQANGLQPLKLNLTMSGEAGNYAQDMINRNYFSHISPEGKSPVDRVAQAGVNSSYVGENLAINISVAAAETAFMNDAGHRANILNANFTDVGIGVRRNAAGQVYVVQDFAKL